MKTEISRAGTPGREQESGSVWDRRVQPLFDLLEAEEQRIDTTLQRLDALRAALVKQDEEALRALLEQIAAEQPIADQQETRRRRLQTELAAAAGCEPDTLNISRLCGLVGPSMRERLRHRQRHIQQKVRRLQSEHRLTVLLLRDCARINQALLRCLLGDVATPTYDARGQSDRQLHTCVMSAQA